MRNIEDKVLELYKESRHIFRSGGLFIYGGNKTKKDLDKYINSKKKMQDQKMEKEIEELKARVQLLLQRKKTK